MKSRIGFSKITNNSPAEAGRPLPLTLPFRVLDKVFKKADRFRCLGFLECVLVCSETRLFCPDSYNDRAYIRWIRLFVIGLGVLRNNTDGAEVDLNNRTVTCFPLTKNVILPNCCCCLLHGCDRLRGARIFGSAMLRRCVRRRQFLGGFSPIYRFLLARGETASPLAGRWTPAVTMVCIVINSILILLRTIERNISRYNICTKKRFR